MSGSSQASVRDLAAAVVPSEPAHPFGMTLPPRRTLTIGIARVCPELVGWSSIKEVGCV